MEEIHSPFENLLEMYIVEKKAGFCKIGLPYRKVLTNPHGNFHGGVIASLADTASVQALRMVFPPGPYLTVALEIRYRDSSNSGDIFAEATAKQLRGKFFVSEVKILNKEDKLLAEAKVKLFLPKWSEKGD